MKARLSQVREVWWLSEEGADFAVELRSTGRSEEWTVCRTTGEEIEGPERERVLNALLRETREGRAQDFRQDFLPEWD